MQPRIVLFDLDGTVVTYQGPPPGPGRTALDRAMRDGYGLEGTTDGLRVAGATDRALVRALLLRAGVYDDEKAIDRLLVRYLAHLGEVVQTRSYRPVGPVDSAVRQLREKGIVVGIATGNVREGARIKLTSAGLGATFDFGLGGFGCDAEPRADIVRLAADRCGRNRPDEVVVVGDTDRDVLAGRAIGARVIGVALDARARAELEAAGADAIVDACGNALVDRILS